MSSSTSSFSPMVVPRGHWPIAMGSAALVLMLVVLGWEFYIRAHAATLPVDDSVDLWVDMRRKASLLGDRALIFIGSSRSQMAIDPAVAQPQTTLVPVQLSIIATTAVPLLKDLADDESITGTIIADVTSDSILYATQDSIAEQWTRHYHKVDAANQPLYQKLEVTLRQALGRLLTSTAYSAKPYQILFNSQSGGYVYTRGDRARVGNYSLIDQDQAFKNRFKTIFGTAESVRQDCRLDPFYYRRVDGINRSIHKLQQRGAKVILVRYPSDPRMWHYEEIAHPRDLYWNYLEMTTSAQTIHYQDYPSLQKFWLPDGIHMDFKDSPKFTQELLRIIQGKLNLVHQAP